MPTNYPLSDDPRAVRQRMRRRNRTTEADMRLLASARKPLEDWDLEELARGRPRDADGHFRGAPPKWITPVVTMEAKRRLGIRALEDLGSMVGAAIGVVYDMMMNQDLYDDGRPIVDSKTRLQCAFFIIDHVLGKPKQRVEMSGEEAGFKNMLAKALMMRDEGGRMIPAHPVVDLTADEWTDEDDGG